MNAKFCLSRCGWRVSVGAAVLSLTGWAVAQDAAKPDDAKPAAAAAGDADPAKAYQAKFEEWKQLLKELRSLKVKYQTASEADAAAMRTRWNEVVEQGEKLIPELKVLGKAAYAAAPNVDLALARFLVKMVEDDVMRDRYEEAAEITNMLVDNQCEVKEVYQLAAVVAFTLNQFDKAEEYYQKAEESGPISFELAKKYRPAVAEYKKYWAEEEELRKAEAEKNDLPRVKMTTSKGDIVIELFENEAPETVGNFISLVEAKFYDGLSFHRVLPTFMAQGGCPIGNGSGDPGYKIYCECYKEKHRNHFRGSLSMAHAGKDTGGSQFFLTFVPTAHLNGRHTVFGRIIEGMDVLAKLERINPEDPNHPPVDKIIKAEVVRKRDHEYVPNKVK